MHWAFNVCVCVCLVCVPFNIWMTFVCWENSCCVDAVNGIDVHDRLHVVDGIPSLHTDLMHTWARIFRLLIFRAEKTKDIILCADGWCVCTFHSFSFISHFMPRGAISNLSNEMHCVRFTKTIYGNIYNQCSWIYKEIKII